MKKYVAFEAGTAEMEFVDSIEDGKKWLQRQWDDGLALDDPPGSFIAEVVCRGTAYVKDRMANYPCNYEDHACDGTGPCRKKGCDGSDEWPYLREFDEMLEVEFENCEKD